MNITGVTFGEVHDPVSPDAPDVTIDNVIIINDDVTDSDLGDLATTIQVRDPDIILGHKEYMEFNVFYLVRTINDTLDA